MPVLTFDKSAQRYRAANGQFISRVAVVEARQSILREVSRQVASFTAQLRDGAISISDWQSAMRDALKAGHLLSFGIATGGKRNVAQSEWGRLGVALREQYKYLDRFARQIEQGMPVHFGRTRMYANAIRQTHQNQERHSHAAAGFTRIIRHRTARESCAGCVRDAHEWAIEEAPPLGRNECLTNCLCYDEFLK